MGYSVVTGFIFHFVSMSVIGILKVKLYGGEKTINQQGFQLHNNKKNHILTV